MGLLFQSSPAFRFCSYTFYRLIIWTINSFVNNELTLTSQDNWEDFFIGKRLFLLRSHQFYLVKSYLLRETSSIFPQGFPHPFKYFLFIAKSYLLIRIFSIYCERLSKGPAFLTIPPAPHFLTGKPKTKKYDAAAPA
jgi:hypothetical protein